MENNRTIISTFISIILLSWGISTNFAYAYNPNTTHAGLTQEIVELFNNSSNSKITGEDAELIIQGSINEDNGIRALHHFYDPVYKRGLTLKESWAKDFPNAQYLAAVGAVAKLYWSSSKDWAQNSSEQAGVVNSLTAGISKPFFSAPNDYSWERAIYEYTWGNKKRGLESLGHILHLMEDASVPDHTRNDAHPPYGDSLFHQESPYEDWTNKFDRSNISSPANSINKPYPKFAALNDYFENLANYSNNNFFSKDTTKSKDYIEPKILEKKEEKLSDGENYLFGYTRDQYGNLIRLVQIKELAPWREAEFSLEDKDEKILIGYWSHLSREAVLNGAGVVDLFFKEVEKERQTRILYEKNRSWLGKQVDKFKNAAFSVAGILYGSSVKLSDLAEETPSPSEPPKEVTLAPTPPRPKPPATANEPALSDPGEMAGIAPEPKIPAVAPIAPKAPAGQTDAGVSSPPPLGKFIGGGGAPPPPTEPTPAPTPATEPILDPAPDISLTVQNCDSTAAASGCLLLGTSTAAAWSSAASDLAYYIIKCETSGAACAGFINGTTTATSTTFSVNDDTSYTVSASAMDLGGNQSATTTQNFSVSTRPVVINEIAWMGNSASTSADEWIELKNRTNLPISLDNWVLYSQTDQKPYLNLSGSIPANGYYLIERTDETTTSVTADLVAAFGSGSGMGLANSGEVLVLSYASTTIDQTPSPCGASWCGGSDTTYQTMERYDPDASGDLISNWGTNNQSVMNGLNADGGAISGTPKARNSLNYTITLSSSATLNASRALSFATSPYVVPNAVTIASGTTLTIEPGAVIKFTNNGELTVNGVLTANGTAGNAIVFTSIKDDTAGGDLNGDGGTTTPAAGDWKKITLNSSGSSITHARVSYGGHFFSNYPTESRAMIFANNAAATVSDSVIEESENMGISLYGAGGSVISGNTVRYNDSPNDPGFAASGVTVSGGGSPTISSNTFDANRSGLKVENAAPTVTDNTFTSNLDWAISLASGSLGTTFSSNTASGSPFNGVRVLDTATTSVSLSSSNLPYTGTLNVSAAGALTIPAGTLFKNINMNSSGVLNIAGTPASPVIFTALADDTYGGDSQSNGDNAAICAAEPANAVCPQPGSWSRVIISGTATSTISNALIRFGNSSPYFGALYVNGGKAEVSGTIIEKSQNTGLFIQNGGSVNFSGGTLRNNGTGIASESSFLVLTGSTFRDNSIGLNVSGGAFTDGGGNDIDSSNTTKTVPSGLVP